MKSPWERPHPARLWRSELLESDDPHGGRARITGAEGWWAAVLTAARVRKRVQARCVTGRAPTDPSLDLSSAFSVPASRCIGLVRQRVEPGNARLLELRRTTDGAVG